MLPGGPQLWKPRRSRGPPLGALVLVGFSNAYGSGDERKTGTTAVVPTIEADESTRLTGPMVKRGEFWQPGRCGTPWHARAAVTPFPTSDLIRW